MKRLTVFAAFAVTAIGAFAQSTTKTSSDDTWFYKNASSPATLPYMLTWGNGTSDLDATFPPGDFFAYSYVKFDLSGVYDSSKTYTVSSASLTVTQYAHAGYDKATADANPLLARALGDGWDEATFAFGASNPAPGSLLGNGSDANYDANASFTISINLLSDQAAMDSLFGQAVHGNSKIDFALTTNMNPGGQQGTKFYQLYTHEAGPNFAPVLSISAKVVPEPSELAALVCGMLVLAGKRRKGK